MSLTLSPSIGELALRQALANLITAGGAIVVVAATAFILGRYIAAAEARYRRSSFLRKLVARLDDDALLRKYFVVADPIACAIRDAGDPAVPPDTRGALKAALAVAI